MPLQIYNSQTRRKEPFAPLDPEGRRVTIYNCGPTVYDHFHVGNARNFVVMDVARRYLARRYEVRFVQNLTDVDDKIIRRSHEEGRTFDEVRETYIAAYFEDAARLRIRVADVHPRATEFIDGMIELGRTLEEKGLAYRAEDGLYFAVRSFEGYGKLSGRALDDLLEGARVEVNEGKRDPLDFALWKSAKPGEPSWESPWGAGRPGWHLECSCMAMKLLGPTIDIHSGGVDLKFPHHENEIAQSEGCTGRTFARFWMHNGFLNIDGAKMAKSAGNFLKIDKVLSRHPVEAVRAFMLSAHYRSPLDYTEEALVEAAAACRRIHDGLDVAARVLALVGRSGVAASDAPGAGSEFLARFEEAMDDDFNSPRAIAAMHDLVTAIHETLAAKKLDADRLEALLGAGLYLRDFFDLAPSPPPDAPERLARVAAIFSELAPHAERLELAPTELAPPTGCAEPSPGSASSSAPSPDPLVERLIELRKTARKKKAFDLADLVRTRLGEAGVALEDRPQGTIWRETR